MDPDDGACACCPYLCRGRGCVRMMMPVHASSWGSQACAPPGLCRRPLGQDPRLYRSPASQLSGSGALSSLHNAWTLARACAEGGLGPQLEQPAGKQWRAGLPQPQWRLFIGAGALPPCLGGNAGAGPPLSKRALRAYGAWNLRSRCMADPGSAAESTKSADRATSGPSTRLKAVRNLCWRPCAPKSVPSPILAGAHPLTSDFPAPQVRDASAARAEDFETAVTRIAPTCAWPTEPFLLRPR